MSDPELRSPVPPQFNYWLNYPYATYCIVIVYVRIRHLRRLERIIEGDFLYFEDLFWLASQSFFPTLGAQAPEFRGSRSAPMIFITCVVYLTAANTVG